jgi:hypothetical protein
MLGAVMFEAETKIIGLAQGAQPLVKHDLSIVIGVKPSDEDVRGYDTCTYDTFSKLPLGTALQEGEHVVGIHGAFLWATNSTNSL